MQKTLFFAAGTAVGFVLGTRAGRQTYEKMKNQSAELWHSPTVQEKVSEATETVKAGAPKLQQKVGALAKKATNHGADGAEASAIADTPVDASAAESSVDEATTPAPVVEPTLSPSTGSKPAH
ncbi:YtxH domain-containing protein [Nocardia sp. 348MFTsu5.1]|uniref:YtxH domain-containing protein n=1 Tax=Nocardia sp. 348MFTsu5.1 TaxID=1172185 RepID=UPI000379C8E4|nr:YtxH domain-containing protein [Nocardia sp. 348MFTsu5.1]